MCNKYISIIKKLQQNRTTGTERTHRKTFFYNKITQILESIVLINGFIVYYFT